LTDQKVDGSGNNVVGRDNHSTANYFLSTAIEDVQAKFEALDKKVAEHLGQLATTTSDETEFGSEKLFVSLVDIGIPVSISLRVAINIFPYIQEAIEDDGVQFSTAHVRKAVSHAILHMAELELSRSQRQDLAAKYARNYGNPKHINMIVFADGRTEPITYKFLVDVFLPTMFRNLTGASSDDFTMISRNNFEHMAAEIIDSVRRLGIYHIKYKTIMCLAEDLATQLPHPWVAIDATYPELLEHDLLRRENHLKAVLDPETKDVVFWRSAYECFNHSCSLILSRYRCPVGGGTHAPANTLRNVTRLKAEGDHQNLALWDFCDISQLEEDLSEHGTSVNAMHSNIKSLQRDIDRMRPEKMEFVRSRMKEFSELALAIACGADS